MRLGQCFLRPKHCSWHLHVTSVLPNTHTTLWDAYYDSPCVTYYETKGQGQTALWTQELQSLAAGCSVCSLPLCSSSLPMNLRGSRNWQFTIDNASENREGKVTERVFTGHYCYGEVTKYIVKGLFFFSSLIPVPTLFLLAISLLNIYSDFYESRPRCCSLSCSGV